MKHPAELQLPREERLPLYVQVTTTPALASCWSVNVSPSGIGLVAQADAASPAEGDSLDVEFTLPGASAVRARGVVRWRHDARGTLSLGVSFQGFAGADGVRLGRFLAAHRAQVVAAFVPLEQRGALEEALSDEAQLHFADTKAEALAALGRGDVCAVLAWGDPARAEALAELLSERAVPDELAGGGQPRDLAPRLLLCSRAEPARLVRLFNAGQLFRALGDPPEPSALRAAVADAQREHGVRLEQRRVALALERALLRERRALGAANAEPEAEGPVFASPAMRRVLELARLAAPHRVAVLLQGETGTGKEVLARQLHAWGEGAGRPFVVQDCGALTETLLESELFGHVKGAFTGAVADHPGLFVLADGGTIFLDEIENTTANLQAKLLRVIETGEVRPVGGAQVRQVSVRVVAASNRPLEAEVQAGRFRADLFYRLNTFTLDVPPLRERPDDLLPLARHLLAQANRALGRSAPGLTPEAEQALRAHRWPGNVRELRNALERAVLLSAPGQALGPELLPEAVLRASASEAGPAGTLRERVEAFERELIRQALSGTGGVVRAAARALGADAVTLGRKVKRYRLG